MDLIRFDDFTFKYPATFSSPALSGINLNIRRGEIMTLCGPSGCGKSTLINLCKSEIAPVGIREGVMESGLRSDEIAIVFQNPEAQIVTTTVINELAFQMENQGLAQAVMKSRMAETVGFFGLENLLHKETASLSGGQKQLVALCAAMMIRPKLLLLDEPVSQLDPISCKLLIETLIRINQELNVTILLAEHRLDDTLAMSHRIAFMDKGRILYAGENKNVLRSLFLSQRPDYASFVPHVARSALTIDESKIAITPKEFQLLYPSLPRSVKSTHRAEKDEPIREPLIKARGIVFRYSKADPPSIYNLDISIGRGERLCILGGNGSGKTTFLKLLAGILKPTMGKIKNSARKIGYMPQNVRAYFLTERVRDEIDWLNGEDARIMEIADMLGITSLLDAHPFDISGGEQQKAVFLALLSRNPDLIILDEPTKGLDPHSKTLFAGIIDEFFAEATVITATHDLEFAGGFAGTCGMFFDGGLAYSLPPRQFFTDNTYYTTSINKCLRHIDESAVYYKDVLELWDIVRPSYLEEYF